MKKKVLLIFALLCAVAQGALADNINLSTVTKDVEAKNGDVLTGTTSHKVSIAAGATVTLSGVTINGGNTAENVCCIQCLGDATIILAEGTTNELTCFGYYSTALRAGGSGTTLTICTSTNGMNDTLQSKTTVESAWSRGNSDFDDEE